MIPWGCGEPKLVVLKAVVPRLPIYFFFKQGMFTENTTIILEVFPSISVFAISEMLLFFLYIYYAISALLIIPNIMFSSTYLLNDLSLTSLWKQNSSYGLMDLCTSCCT